MPPDFLHRAMNAVHGGLLRASGNRLGARVSGMQVVQLTTRGRVSGRPSTVHLTVPVREGDTLVLVAARGGDRRNPDWLLNLRANPDVLLASPGEPDRPMRARVASAAERERLWPQVVAAWPQYDTYQHKAGREIPLALLAPPGPPPTL